MTKLISSFFEVASCLCGKVLTVAGGFFMLGFLLKNFQDRPQGGIIRENWLEDTIGVVNRRI